MGKFSYGLIDKDLTEERVDVYVQSNCAGPWELIADAWTTQDGDHPTTIGVEDSGGRVYVPIDPPLPPGRHRIHMVVRGDLSTSDGIVEVVPAGAPVFISGMDGTLTTYETEEFVELLTGDVSDARPGSAVALTMLAERGYRPMYLTARPEWLVERSREFLEVRGYPPGILHTTTELDGALGDAAVGYKTDELGWVLDRGFLIEWVFGNTDSDAEAYDVSDIQPLDHRVFIEFDDPFGGRRIESYVELLDEFADLPSLCP